MAKINNLRNIQVKGYFVWKL